ncbi:MAG: hypothetical protein JSV62_11815 [Promethearchaeota archaeon]|nr:MAG: hypothetical protein JSV62_11815 [Candidatus Lokiarchaeota archaeon]
MPKLQKYQQKIRKYKERLKRLITRIGISYSADFDLKDEKLEKLILPCHLGILFFGDFDIDFFFKIKHRINQVYDSFFFNIKNLGDHNFSFEIFSKGVKKEYREMKKSSDRIKIHPTNKFYEVLINKRIEEKLGMIVAITDLPIYSSSNDNVLFLFGETNLKHRCCVVSSLKLKEQYYGRNKNQDLFEERVIKEVIHEIGHIIMDSTHCVNYLCVMRFSKGVNEIDDKSSDFCSKCKLKLNQIRTDHNF